MVVLIIVIDPCSSACNWEQVISKQFLKVITTAHPWCDGHSTSISVCGVWEVRVGVQVYRREFHTHIHID